MNQYVPILAVAVWVITFLLYRPGFFRRPLPGGKRWLLALLQVIPLLLLVWLLSNPTSEREKTENQHGVVVVLLDDSPSMGMEDGESGRPRLDVGRDWVSSLLVQQETGQGPGKWVTHSLNEYIPDGRSGSDFAEGFQEVSRRIPQRLLEAVVFVSDGQDRSQSSLEGALKTLGVPVHTLGLGPDTPPDQTRVRWKSVPEQANPGAPFLVGWSADSDRQSEGLFSVTITFASEEVHQESLTFPEGRDYQSGWVTIRPKIPGKQTLRIAARDENEPDAVSIAEATVTVNERPKTILFLESIPTRLGQSLSQIALESGRFRILRPVSLPQGGGVVWDLTRSILEEGSPISQNWEGEEFERLSPTEWSTRLEGLLLETSVVVLGQDPLGRAPDEWTSALAEAASKLNLGWLTLPGSELALDRARDTSLENLLERTANRKESRDSLRLVIDESGRDHPALAPLWSFQDGIWEIGRDTFFRTTTPTTQTLITDMQSRGLIVQVPFGLGKATMVSTDNLWRLRSYAGGTHRGNRETAFLAGLWLGILDDLSGRNRTEEIAIILEPQQPTLGQSTQIRVQDPGIYPGPARGGLELRPVGAENWETLLVSPDNDWPGMGEAIWTPRSSGEFEIRYASGENPLAVTVLDRPAETEDISLNEDILKDIAELSGGTYHKLTDLDAEELDIVPQKHALTRTEKTPLRHDVWMGILIAGFLCLGWGIRRAWSLP